MVEDQNVNNTYNQESIKKQEEKFKTNIKKMNDFKYRSFKQIVNSFYNDEVEELYNEEELIKIKGDITIEPEIIYDKLTNDMKVQFKSGNQKMYKIIFCKLCWLTKILNPTGYKLTPTYDAIWAMFILVWLLVYIIVIMI